MSLEPDSLAATAGAWETLYEHANCRLDSATGYYNNNVRIDLAESSVNVRIPIPGAEVMDLRLWREPAVLAGIAPHVGHIPGLLHACDLGRFQVHQFAVGDVLNQVAPRGTPVADHVIDDVVELFAQLCAVPRGSLPRVSGWPTGDDTAGVARALSDFTQRLFERFRDEYGPLYASLGFPPDPLAPIRDLWRSLARRPLRFTHSDVHRKNIIVADGRSVFLDWELSLWGDPVYDLAVHLHKMEYLPEEQSTMLARWAARLPAESTAGWEADLDRYLAHEQVKSAIVDSVRYAQAFARRDFQDPPDELIEKLTTKINNARNHWAVAERTDKTEIGGLLRAWGDSHIDG